MRLTESNPLKDFVSLKFTSKNPIFLDYDKGDAKVVEELLNKLGQLEDIEDELGIELSILFKALENGIWCKCCLFDDAKISYRKPDFISLKNKCLVQECDDGSLHSSTYFIYYYSKDYGKTWALTKEELE